MRYPELLNSLEPLIDKVLIDKKRALISVVGKNGVGKSHFGRYVRKNGLGRYGKNNISVIDDRVMTLQYLGVFKRKIRIPDNGVDEIRPYLARLPRQIKIVLYINNSPHKKITKADVLLKLSTDEQTRKERLQQRYAHDPEKFEKYYHNSEGENYNIKFDYFWEADI
jgi:hypothetical protein